MGGLSRIHYPAYLRFIKEYSRSIATIVYKTGGEYTVDDVKGELWITADSLQEKKSLKTDFDNPEHQELIVSHTYQRLVRYTETTVRYAASLDVPLHEDSPNPAERLANSNVDNPGDVLDARQKTVVEEGTLTAQGMSLGVAWLMLLEQSGGRMVKVAGFLKLSRSHTYRCYQKVRVLAEQQASLSLESGGVSGCVVKPWRKFRQYRAPKQLAFDFDPGLDLA